MSVHSTWYMKRLLQSKKITGFYSCARTGFKTDFIPDGSMVFPAALQKKSEASPVSKDLLIDVDPRVFPIWVYSLSLIVRFRESSTSWNVDWSCSIVREFDKRFSSTTAEAPVEFQIDTMILTYNLSTLRLQMSR